jgi:hypothetical protein
MGRSVWRRGVGSTASPPFFYRPSNAANPQGIGGQDAPKNPLKSFLCQGRQGGGYFGRPSTQRLIRRPIKRIFGHFWPEGTSKKQPGCRNQPSWCGVKNKSIFQLSKVGQLKIPLVCSVPMGKPIHRSGSMRHVGNSQKMNSKTWSSDSAELVLAWVRQNCTPAGGEKSRLRPS